MTSTFHGKIYLSSSFLEKLKIGFYQLNTRLKNLWKLTGGFELMDVANGFFMVKFGLEVDKTKVINEGPWMVFDHHLAVSH